MAWQHRGDPTRKWNHDTSPTPSSREYQAMRTMGETGHRTMRGVQKIGRMGRWIGEVEGPNEQRESYQTTTKSFIMSQTHRNAFQGDASNFSFVQRSNTP
jgi:hypothetical protein